jgi:hypothetical protein
MSGMTMLAKANNNLTDRRIDRSIYSWVMEVDSRKLEVGVGGYKSTVLS